MLIDIHTHAGQAANGVAALESMLPGGVDLVVSAVVADKPAMRRNAEGRPEQFRTPDAGEYTAATENGIRTLEQRGMRLVREAEDIAVGTPGMALAIEGCHFVDGDLDRFDAMEARGVRSIQLAHYVVNEMCDIQTAPEVHGGLTSIGKAAVRRMNDIGIIVDVAHCNEATVRGVAATASLPFICSHSNLVTEDLPGKDYSRYISADYARMVADGGGVVGAWLASKLKSNPLPGLISHMFRLIDTIGVEHVAIGTDMPAGGCAGVIEDFSRHRELRAALVDRGMNEDEVDKVCGGNWLRVFRAVRSAAR
jgi:membrane dipeptidase